MYRLVLFLRRIHVFVLFIIMQSIAIWMFASSNAYQRAKLIGVTSSVTGVMWEKLSDMRSYFGLKSENKMLVEQVAKLKSDIANMQWYMEQSHMNDEYSNIKGSSASQYFESSGNIAYLPMNVDNNVYSFQVADVVRNSISRRDNFIVIDKGHEDGINKDMALTNDQGIVGYVLATSANYSVAMSVLNSSSFRTSGRIKGSDFTGSISWDGVDYRVVDFKQVPKYAKIEVGDTILTTEYSNIFPSDIPIGRVLEFELRDGTFYDVRLELFADLNSLRHVYVIGRKNQHQRDSLERLYIK